MPESQEPPLQSAGAKIPQSRKASAQRKWFKKTIGYALYRSVMDGSFSPLGDYIEGEWHTVKRTAKKSPGLCLLFVAAIAFLAFLIKGRLDKPQIDRLENTISYMSGVIVGISNDFNSFKADAATKRQEDTSQITQLKIDLNESKREKDAEIEKLNGQVTSMSERLALLESMPSNAITLYSNVASLTNFLAINKPYDVDFELSINGERATNEITLPTSNLFFGGQPITLSASREIMFAVKNIGVVSAVNLNVIFSPAPAIQNTNVLSDGWQCDPYENSLTPGLNSFNWTWGAQHSVAAGSTYSINFLKISTNFFDSFPVTALVEVHADRTRSRKYYFSLRLPPQKS